MTKLKIGFDISPLQNGNAGRGVGYYTQSLLTALKQRDDLEIVEFSDINKLTKVDLVHYPYFDLLNRSLSFKQPYPFVVTIHDLTPILFPKHYPAGIKGNLNWHWQRWMARKAAQVITISEASKKDIVVQMDLPARQVSVVYEAADTKFNHPLTAAELISLKQKYSLPDQYLIYVGNVNWNKNILSVAQAAIDTNLPLILVGKSFSLADKTTINHPEMASYKQFIKQYAANPLIKMLGFVEDQDLVGLYQSAMIALFPSYYEGFGLPILEAQSCGVPVITSKTSSMPEVAGDSAILVDPYNQLEINQAIEQLKDAQVRQQYIKKGYTNIKRFSWSKSASEVYHIYKGILFNK